MDKKMLLSWTDIETKLNQNNFDDLIKLKLNIGAYRIKLKHKFDPASVVAIGKIDPLPHQIEAFIKMMSLLRPQTKIDGRIRILLADDVGLGKTIMIGLVMKELILRNKINRILIVLPSGLQIQWKNEIKEKFNEEFKIIKGKLVSNQYIEENKAIISIDIGRTENKLEALLQASWDMVIFDEAHKLKPNSLRYKLALELSKLTKHLILASATPHDGKVENFISLIKLVDNELEYSSNSGELRKYLEPLMIRRLKEDVIDFKGKKIFPNRDTPQTININYTVDERNFYNEVENYVTTYYQKAEESKKTTTILALYILHRRVSSSIKAGLNSLKNRRTRLIESENNEETNKYLDYIDEFNEIEAEETEEKLIGSTASKGEDLRIELKSLDELIEFGEKLVREEKDSKFKKLIELVRELRKERPNDKIIIFTEFKDTLKFLEEKLTYNGDLVSKITGGMDIEEKKEQAKLFETSSHILLGTEAAGEGLNLQFANIVINYELPWNPNRLEQRIGRVYRYGQEKRVFIHNFKTAFPIDDAVLKKINEKMDNIRMTFGDSAVDVIGSLISEKDMLEIFKAARTIGSNIDEILTEKSEMLKEILKEIDKFRIKNQFNLIKDTTQNISSCITNFDIERFFLSYIQQKDGAEYSITKDGQFFFNIMNDSFKGTFDIKSKENYIALGHQVLEKAIEDSLKFSPISSILSKEKGVIVTFILKFFNGLNNEIYSEPLIILKTKNELKILDPLMIWEMNEAKALIKKEELEEYKKLLLEVIDKPELLIKDKINSLINFVKKKNLKDLEIERNYIYLEYDWKLKNETQKRDEHSRKGHNYLISGIDKKISELKSDYNKMLSDNETSKIIKWELCELVNIAFLIPYDNKNLEDFKKIVELKGMEIVMKYEKEQNREPKDVSLETIKGYDIESSSLKEIRYIEVKSSSEENKIIMTSNEWRTASLHQNDYYLYVVQNVFSDPKLCIIQNPHKNLEKYMKKEIIDDYRMVLDKLPNNISSF